MRNDILREHSDQAEADRNGIDVCEGVAPVIAIFTGGERRLPGPFGNAR
jgi:hypothetical protein